MRYQSMFDIIGPLMVGPSSSHTAGAAKIGKIARDLFAGKPDKAVITFYGSFAKTHKGHGTDIAVVAGLLGLKPDDGNLRNSFRLANENNIEIEFHVSQKDTRHQNTVDIVLTGGGAELSVRGVSIGGGKVNITEIDGFQADVSGDGTVLLVFHKDDFGAIALVTGILASDYINVGNMTNSRTSQGNDALMVIEVDSEIHEGVLDTIRELPLVSRVTLLKNDIM